MASSTTSAQASEAKSGRQLYKLKLSGDFFTHCQYKRGDQLGHGITGSVYLATHRFNPERKTAVKVMPLKDGRLPEDRVWKAFERELRVFERTDHVGIMKCSIAVMCPDYLAITMKFYPKGSLIRNALSIPVLVKPWIAACICDALRYLHKKQIIHGDIKMDNVLVDDDYRPVLTDFGNAKLLWEQVTEIPLSMFGGTKSYWPPELLNVTADSMVDPYKVDTYCLGVTVLTLLTLTPARGRDHLLEVTSNDRVSSLQRPVLKDMLNPDPMIRISAATAFEKYISVVRATCPRMKAAIKRQ